jgi:hypothetical protein
VDKENESLKATVARYQKELKDRAQASAGPAVASKPAAKAGSEMLASKPQEALSGPLASAKPSLAKEGEAAAKPPAAPASPADKEPKPVEEPAGFWAIIKRWLLNLWHLIF